MATLDLQAQGGRSEGTGVSDAIKTSCGKPLYPVYGEGYAQYFTKQGRRSLPYEVFLKTGYWYQIRKFVLERDGHRCANCQVTQKLHVHHKTYEHRGDEFNHLEDLITLCERCHEIEHETLDAIAALAALTQGGSVA